MPGAPLPTSTGAPAGGALGKTGDWQFFLSCFRVARTLRQNRYPLFTFMLLPMFFPRVARGDNAVSSATTKCHQEAKCAYTHVEGRPQRRLPQTKRAHLPRDFFFFFKVTAKTRHAFRRANCYSSTHTNHNSLCVELAYTPRQTRTRQSSPTHGLTTYIRTNIPSHVIFDTEYFPQGASTTNKTDRQFERTLFACASFGGRPTGPSR